MPAGETSEVERKCLVLDVLAHGVPVLPSVTGFAC
jgi:hypothetical protein